MKEIESIKRDSLLPLSEQELENAKSNLIEIEKDEVKNPIKRPNKYTNFFNTIFPCLHKVNTTTRRIVFFNKTQENITIWSNKEENQKYNLLFFIPVVLFNQFKQFGNMFYLLLTISQFFPQFKCGYMFTYYAPLCIVVGFSMCKELYDDIKRRLQDKKINSTQINTLVLNRGNRMVNKIPKPASELQIGDIIELNKDNRIPADIIVLKTFNDTEDNQAFIRTDQLDGETDWKLRKAPGLTQEKSERDLVNLNGFMQYEPPSKLIYNFEGVLKFTNDQGVLQKEPLNLENTMWASTVLASQKIIGIVIYTGKETRARMNSSTPKYKIGILDKEINRQTIYLCVIMVCIALLLACLKGFTKTWFFNFVKFIVLFCAIIPIALRVTLDVSKTWLSYAIGKDETIPETIARNSTLPEELGRISYVFSDKTGTLTKNEMIFKKIAMETEQFGQESFNDLKQILSEECVSGDAPLLDIYNFLKYNNNDNLKENEKKLINEINTDISNSQENSNVNVDNNLPSKQVINKAKKIRRERSKLIRDTITAMVLCNNVTPTESGYQASSPDEIALVKFAETLNMRLTHRTDKEISIKDSAENLEESWYLMSAVR